MDTILFNLTPRNNVPIIARLVGVYKIWHETMPHMAKTSRYTLGEKIDDLFIETSELIFRASYVTRDRKLPYLEGAIAKLDLLKFFLQISWEIKVLDNKKYVMISEPLAEIGRMLGGWARQITTPPGDSRVVKK